MPRKLTIEFTGAAYHLISGGDGGEAVFLSDRDRRSFLRTLQEVCERTAWLIHSCALLKNHCHLLIETPEPNPAAGTRWLQGIAEGIRPASVSGPAVRQHGRQAARALLEQGLSAMGLSRSGLTGPRKHDPRKQAQASVIRSRTPAPNRWLPEHLHTGHESNMPEAVRCMRESPNRDPKRRMATLEGTTEI